MMDPDEVKELISAQVLRWESVRQQVIALEESDEDEEADDYRDIQNDIANHIVSDVMSLIKMGDEVW